MNNPSSDDFEIPDEYAAVFEAMEGADMEKFWQWLKTEVRNHDIKLREWGTEKQVRLMLVDRANECTAKIVAQNSASPEAQSEDT